MCVFIHQIEFDNAIERFEIPCKVYSYRHFIFCSCEEKNGTCVCNSDIGYALNYYGICVAQTQWTPPPTTAAPTMAANDCPIGYVSQHNLPGCPLPVAVGTFCVTAGDACSCVLNNFTWTTNVSGQITYYDSTPSFGSIGLPATGLGITGQTLQGTCTAQGQCKCDGCPAGNPDQPCVHERDFHFECFIRCFFIQIGTR